MFTLVPRYVLSRFVPWFGVCLIGATLLTLTAQLLRTSPVFAGSGSGLRMGLLLSVPLAAFATGPSVLVALFVTAFKMRGEDELLAADALGIRRARIQALLVLFVAAVAAVNGIFWWFTIPSALKSAQEIATARLEAAVTEGISPGRFHSPFPGFTIFAKRRQANGVLENVFVVRETASSRFEAAAESAEIRLVDGEALISFRNGRLYYTYTDRSGKAVEDGAAKNTAANFSINRPGRATVSFGTFALRVSVREELVKKLDFLPDLLCRASAELVAPPPPGVSPARWAFARYRREAAPFGVLFLGLFGVLAAFGAEQVSRKFGGLSAGIVFFLFHLSGRLGEASAVSGRLPPSIGAFASPLVAAFLCVVWIILLRIVAQKNSGLQQ